ncbi:MAG: pyridoxamine 5'-phosphate oxidase family protein [Pseudomonadota bacterium]
MTDNRIDSVEKLEALVGTAALAVRLKVIDHLDEHALRWVAAAPLMFAGFGDGSAMAITIGGGAPGFVGADRATLHLPIAALDDPALARPGRSFCSLFLAPGIAESLRVNGRVTGIDGDRIRIAVEECYVHCSKALIRSSFWSAAPVSGTIDDEAAFVAASRFMALATIDAAGRADLSPKGDPAGRMARIDRDRFWFADRPGNRRVDSFRNMIAQPRIAAILLLPGSHQVARITGIARLTTDEAERRPFTVQAKLPLLAASVEDLSVEMYDSPALERARLWPARARATGIEPAKAFVAHVKLNKDKGFAAKLAGAVLSVPGLVQKGLDKDYETNLY